jgi:hypothetical protein
MESAGAKCIIFPIPHDVGSFLVQMTKYMTIKGLSHLRWIMASLNHHFQLDHDGNVDFGAYTRH